MLVPHRTPTFAVSHAVGVAIAAVLLGAPAVATLQQARPARSAPINPDAVRERLQAALDALHAAGQFPGATAGVVLADGTSFGLATGFSDPVAKTPMSPGDRMLMGSAGKTYAAAVALQLVQERRLSLADRIERWFATAEWFPRLPNARDITVRMLMNHTSGLVPYEFNEQFTADLTKQPDRIWRPEELLTYVLDTTPPFAAGQGWQYSDTNYIVLGMILERVTGAPYYQEMSRRLLVP
ncbi:MAG: beta-lactamase family protein, partial [Acidobacteria bacterium]|nr:beta-lactamase family protein [Acidobacteriota bacterium]